MKNLSGDRKTSSKIELCGVNAQAILPHYVSPVAVEKRGDRGDANSKKGTTTNLDGVIHDGMMVGSGDPNNKTVKSSLGAVAVSCNFNSNSLMSLEGGVSPPKEVVETFDGVLSLQLELKTLVADKEFFREIMAPPKIPTPLGNSIEKDDRMVSTKELIALQYIDFYHDVNLCS